MYVLIYIEHLKYIILKESPLYREWYWLNYNIRKLYRLGRQSPDPQLLASHPHHLYSITPRASNSNTENPQAQYLNWHTHFPCGDPRKLWCHYYLICLNWVLRGTVMPSTVWRSDYVRAQPQVGRTLRRGWISSYHWWSVTWILSNVPVGPMLSELGEIRTDLQHRGHWWLLTLSAIDESCTNLHGK